MAQSLSDLTDALITSALRAGADAADALAVDGTSLSIDVRQGELEQAERSEGVDIGLRVLIGQRQACVSASDTRADTIQTMAERAVAMAREAPEDPTIGIAEMADLAVDTGSDGLELADPSDDPTAADLQQVARVAEQSALAINGVTQVQAASAGYGRHHIHLAASNGFSAGYSRTTCGIACLAITGDGVDMERDYASETRVFQADLPNPAEVGTLAGERAIARAGARKPKTGAFPVLYDQRVASTLIGHLLSATNGGAIVRGSSWARDLLNEQVLPAELSIIEDPLRKRISGSRLFDAEGLPTKPRAIVENGILTGWTLDLATARKLNLTSTANAARGTSSPPSPSVTNVALTPGSVSQNDLIADMGTGLLVTSMIGASINPTTGDYSRGASGFWVENGEIAYPVNECTIAGNLLDMLRTIVPANDIKPHLSHVVPSLLVEGLTIAGE